jgi:hypothetical protein
MRARQIASFLGLVPGVHEAAAFEERAQEPALLAREFGPSAATARTGGRAGLAGGVRGVK